MWRIITMGFAEITPKKSKQGQRKILPIGIGASSSVAVFLAGYITQWIGIPEYTTEVTAILTALIGIVAGLLKPHHD